MDFLNQRIHDTRMAYWRIAKPIRYGAKAFLQDEAGRLLLVRHTYGDDRWNLPGGGYSSRRESAITAARREVKEELGVLLDKSSIKVLGKYVSGLEYKRDTITIVGATLPDKTTVKSSREIAEFIFVGLDDVEALSVANVVLRGLDFYDS